MTSDNITTSQRMALESAVRDYLDAGATEDEVTDDVETFCDDWKQDNKDDDD